MLKTLKDAITFNKEKAYEWRTRPCFQIR